MAEHPISMNNALDYLLWGSLISFVLSLIAIPWIIVRLPADYFAHDRRAQAKGRERHPLAGLLLATLKNLLGMALVATGVVLLVLPGQGILTILLGLGLMNFPGKYHLEQRLIRRPAVARSLNWLRRRYGKAPLSVPEDSNPQA